MGSLKKMDSVERDLKNDSPILYVNGIRRVLPHDLAHFTLLEYLRGIYYYYTQFSAYLFKVFDLTYLRLSTNNTSTYDTYYL